MPELLLLLALLLRTIAAETETVAAEPDTGDTYTSLDQVETVEGFMRTREFKVDTEHDILPNDQQLAGWGELGCLQPFPLLSTPPLLYV